MNLTAALASGYEYRYRAVDGIWVAGLLGIWLIIALLAFIGCNTGTYFNKNSAQQQKTDMAKSDF